MEFLELIFGCFFLFVIIAAAVKMAVKEALREFKDEIIQELHAKKVDNEDKKDTEVNNASEENDETEV